MLTCRVCGGEIVEETQWQKTNFWEPDIYGPGSRNQYAKVVIGHYCSSCGIRYKIPVA